MQRDTEKDFTFWEWVVLFGLAVSSAVGAMIPAVLSVAEVFPSGRKHAHNES